MGEVGWAYVTGTDGTLEELLELSHIQSEPLLLQALRLRPADDSNCSLLEAARQLMNHSS